MTDSQRHHQQPTFFVLEPPPPPYTIDTDAPPTYDEASSARDTQPVLTATEDTSERERGKPKHCWQLCACKKTRFFVGDCACYCCYGCGPCCECAINVFDCVTTPLPVACYCGSDAMSSESQSCCPGFASSSSTITSTATADQESYCYGLCTETTTFAPDGTNSTTSSNCCYSTTSECNPCTCDCGCSCDMHGPEQCCEMVCAVPFNAIEGCCACLACEQHNHPMCVYVDACGSCDCPCECGSCDCLGECGDRDCGDCCCDCGGCGDCLGQMCESLGQCLEFICDGVGSIICCLFKD
eukprot:m.111665 g.111665  ORF g.111665 m.111665 type:complete len:297 (-) comp16128_c0_seq2:84-974(-)